MNQLSLLIVDDEAEILELLSAFFQKQSYLVSTASSGDEALEIYKKNKGFDIVLSDVKMPGKLDGFMLMEQIFALHIPRPVSVMMSGHTDNIPEYFKKLGVLHLLAKPFSTKTAKEVIERANLEFNNHRHSIRKPRFEKSLTTEILFEDGRRSECETDNLSNGGCFIKTDMNINLGTPIILRFLADRNLSINAIIKWARYANSEQGPAGFGVEFKDLSESQSADINYMINS